MCNFKCPKPRSVPGSGPAFFMNANHVHNKTQANLVVWYLPSIILLLIYLYFQALGSPFSLQLLPLLGLLLQLVLCHPTTGTWNNHGIKQEVRWSSVRVTDSRSPSRVRISARVLPTVGSYLDDLWWFPEERCWPVWPWLLPGPPGLEPWPGPGLEPERGPAGVILLE